MSRLTRSSDIARRLVATLDEAVVNADSLTAPMRTLNPEALFAAAARRAELNAQVTGLTVELGDELRRLAAEMGWQEVTLASLKSIDPKGCTILDGLLADVRTRAAQVKKVDDLNRSRGARALSWLRTLLAAHTGQSNAYDRRGAATMSRPVSTARRTI